MKQYKVNPILFLIILIVPLIFIVVFPFVQIWAVNTLFKTSIEYSWLNWFCVMILNSSIGVSSYKGK